MFVSNGNKNNAVVLNKTDNVSVVLEELKAGDEAFYSLDGKVYSFKVIDNVPVYHKFSISAIKKGDAVYKYGQVIGKATCDIEAGRHVHTHNLISIREGIGA